MRGRRALGTLPDRIFSLPARFRLFRCHLQNSPLSFFHIHPPSPPLSLARSNRLLRPLASSSSFAPSQSWTHQARLQRFRSPPRLRIRKSRAGGGGSRMQPSDCAALEGTSLPSTYAPRLAFRSLRFYCAREALLQIDASRLTKVSLPCSSLLSSGFLAHSKTNLASPAFLPCLPHKAPLTSALRLTLSLPETGFRPLATFRDLPRALTLPTAGWRCDVCIYAGVCVLHEGTGGTKAAEKGGICKVRRTRRVNERVCGC